ncbi:MAG: extracellular solute-binding protein [Acholeplasmatales bacterium]|nr:extracellular solute-binding protein [Acholeplasmatales bacterium]
MKKILLLIITIINLTLLASCFNNEKIEITIGMWPESSSTNSVAMFNTWAANFTADYPEYKVIGEPFDYTKEAFVSKATAKNLPTVYQTWFTEPEEIVSGGHAKDITKIVKDLGWYDKMDPELRNYLTFNDKLYGIPRDGYGLGLIINLGVFEDAGLASDLDGDNIIDIVDPNNPSIKYYPTTMDELLEYSVRIKENTGENGFIVLNADKNGGWQYSNIAWNFGAKLQVEENGVWKSNLNSPQAVEAMQFLKNFYLEEVAPIGTQNYSSWKTLLGQNKIGMAICGNDVINDAVTSGGMAKENLAFVPIPAGPNGIKKTLFGGTPYMFSAYASDKAVEGAVKFLEYMGRSPETSDISKQAMLDGMNTATKQGMLILPSISPWINPDYVEYNNYLNGIYVNVSMPNFNDFYTNIQSSRMPEEPYLTQTMYKFLDEVVLGLQNPAYDIVSGLNSKNQAFENELRKYFGN